MGKIMKCLGIDIGGTFTDFILIDAVNNIVELHKVSSTPIDQSVGVKTGLDYFKTRIDNIDVLVHGTTVATNAILENKGVKTALISTKGFSDVIEIGRQNRINLYSFYPERVTPLIPRELRFEIEERLDSTGDVLQPLNRNNLDLIIEKLKEEEVQSVAISLLFSFFNPSHELIISEEVKKQIPRINVSRSSWVLPVFREFDRTSVTVLDAFVAPLMRNYFSSFEEKIQKQGISVPPLILLSTGGVTHIQNAAERSVETVLSGLAGGVLGGYFSSNKLKIPNVLTLDIGGTSTDVASIVNGEISITTENSISGHPIPLPTIAVQTIGAGGGSIARQEYGILCVGPESAGADPGPSCYNKGGKKPTVTDANLMRGLLNPKYFAGGTLQIEPSCASNVITKLSKELRFSTVEECSEGIIEVFENNVALALRKVSTEKGLDSRNFALCCFGGGGPLHACSLAERLSMKKVIIPPFPGVWSAFGLLTADIRHDLTQSIIKPLNNSIKDVLEAEFQDLVEKGITMCVEDGFIEKDVVIMKDLDIRLVGQSYEITVPYDDELTVISDSFDRAHEQAYGYSSPDSPREAVNIRVSALVRLPKFTLASLPLGGKEPSKESFSGVRKVYLKKKWVNAKIYQKSLLRSGNIIQGPSIIEQADSTCLIDFGWEAEVLPDGHLILTNLS